MRRGGADRRTRKSLYRLARTLYWEDRFPYNHIFVKLLGDFHEPLEVAELVRWYCMRKTGKVFVIAGPSGAGKGTLVRQVLRGAPDIHYSVSATTRSPRQGEVDGKDYHFLGEEEFERLLERGEFLELEEVYGKRYGTLTREVEKAKSSGKDVLIEVDVKGALNVRSKVEDAVLIFIMPPSMEELESRLRKRDTDRESEIKARTEIAAWEMKVGEGEFDVVIVNRDVDVAADELARVLRGEQI